MSRSGEIVDFRPEAPPFSSGKTHLSVPLKPEFADAELWAELAEKHLPRHDLPRWSVRPTAEGLKVWLERLDSEKAFLRMGNYRSLDEAIALNPAWPLRALIGLALEMNEDD